MDALRQFILPFLGLKDGDHQFEHRIKKTFFDAFGNEDILGSDIVCHVDLEKKSSMLVLDIRFSGSVDAACDRCMDTCAVSIEGDARLYYKFSQEIDSDNEDVYWLSPSEQEIDYSSPLYDYICLNIPNRKVHEDGECDPDVIDALEGPYDEPGHRTKSIVGCIEEIEEIEKERKNGTS